MNEAQLKELCALWQKRLRLRDWKISVRLCDSHETDGKDAYCRVFQNARLAVVAIVKLESQDTTEEFYKAFPEEYDLEMSLVHELLHIPFDGLMNDDADEHEHIMQEQAIETLSRAFVNLARGE